MKDMDSILASYPIVIIPRERLAATRQFYEQVLGMKLVFGSTWFVGLSHDGGGAPTLALMAHDHPSSPPGPETFDGKGVLLTFQVTDARSTCEQLRAAGVEIVHPLTDEPWGQRRFMIRDPAGTSIDVVQQTEPEPGFWDPYQPELGG
jgi:catechol 2,3-dioxygenase-like lactoylglutathione lyase family enzyme